MTQITSRNHTAWGPIQRVGLLVNTASEDPNEVTEFCGVSKKSK